MLELSRGWNELTVSERKVTMAELVAASKSGALLEAFGAGTAAIISPVNEIVYEGERLVVPTGAGAGPVAQRMWNELTDIQVRREGFI